jgi:hypothetical protein
MRSPSVRSRDKGNWDWIGDGKLSKNPTKNRAILVWSLWLELGTRMRVGNLYQVFWCGGLLEILTVLFNLNDCEKKLNIKFNV